MRVRKAKDFLVEQTTQQAQIEGVSLTDLEKRMMYYAEGKDATANDRKLNDEFDAQYDTAAYEAKIRRLLHDAYARVKESDPREARRWDDTISFLENGDHYISVLWGFDLPKERPPYDFLKLLVSAIVVFCLMMTIAVYSDRMSRFLPQFPIPGWILRRVAALLLIAAFFGLGHMLRKRRARGRLNS
jgi:hypothetical protein